MEISDSCVAATQGNLGAWRQSQYAFVMYEETLKVRHLILSLGLLGLSGFGVSACRGEPDAGIITRVEMEEVARQCVRAAGDVPLIVDGDTGFGGASNLRRTIRGFAEAGAAAVSISA